MRFVCAAGCGNDARAGKPTCDGVYCQRLRAQAELQGRRRRAFGGLLELRRVDDGWCHTLQDRALFCGAELELYLDDPQQPEAYLTGTYDAYGLADPTHTREPVALFLSAVGTLTVNVYMAHFRRPAR